MKEELDIEKNIFVQGQPLVPFDDAIAFCEIYQNYLSPKLNTKSFVKFIHSFNNAIEKRLKNPVKVNANVAKKTIQVCDAFVFEINSYDKKIINYGFLDYFQTIKEYNLVSLKPLMTTSYWLRFIFQQILTPEMWDILSVNDHCLFKLSNCCLSYLNNDKRFQYLQKQLLPQLLELDENIYNLARIVTTHTTVTSEDYSRVWQHQALYLKLYDEGKLLKLMDYAIGDDILKNYSSGTKGLKEYFVNNWMDGSGWRYLCCYGDELFSYIWSKQTQGSRFISARNYLLTLYKAELPVPPLPKIQAVWFQIYGDKFLTDFSNNNHWEDVPSKVLNITFNHLAKSPEYTDSNIDKMLKIFYWSAVDKIIMDKNQIKSGWKWLNKKADNWYEQRQQESYKNNIHWPAYLKNSTLKIEQWFIHELSNNAQLYDAATSMRNCLADYSDDCINGEKRFFTINTKNNNNRSLAVVGLAHDENKMWQIYDVKGFANQSVSKEIQCVAGKFLKIYQSLYEKVRIKKRSIYKLYSHHKRMYLSLETAIDSIIDNVTKRFMKAVYYGDLNAVICELNKGASINSTSRYYVSSLEVAIASSKNSKPLETVKLLLANKADPNLHHSKGWCALFQAVSWQNIEVLELLLTYEANPNIIIERKNSLYDLAKYHYIKNVFPNMWKYVLIKDEDQSEEDWLSHIAKCADAGSQPECLFLLRQYGAKTLLEISQSRYKKVA